MLGYSAADEGVEQLLGGEDTTVIIHKPSVNHTLVVQKDGDSLGITLWVPLGAVGAGVVLVGLGLCIILFKKSKRNFSDMEMQITRQPTRDVTVNE